MNSKTSARPTVALARLGAIRFLGLMLRAGLTFCAAISPAVALKGQSPNLPAAFLGTWTARVSQIPDIGDYHTVMRLVDGALSNIDYTDLACGGTLAVVSVESDRVLMRERITYGQHCIDNGLVSLTLAGNTIDWEWNHETLTQYRGWGTFHRGTSEAPPIFTAESVLNAASFARAGQPGHALAPGSIASIFGTSFFSELVVANGSPLPLSLAGVQVTFNDMPAPVFFVSPRQVNVQIPASLTGPFARVAITNAAGKSDTQMVELAPFAPSIFTLDQSGAGQGVVVFAATGLLVAARGVAGDSRPATAGDVLTIYANGLGPVVPVVPDGLNSCEPDGICSPDFSNLILRRVAVTPSMEIGGIAVPEANISFAGLAPQFAGLYQINLTLPAGIAAGDSVPIIFRQGGASSTPRVTIAVR